VTARGTRGPVVSYNAAGWPDQYSRRLKLCSTQNLGGCATPPVWKVERRGRGYVATAYYCDQDLPDQHRAAANSVR
jgi:hypothetical protein